MPLKTTDLPLAQALSPEAQANVLSGLNASRLFSTPQDPRVAKPRPQFNFISCSETGCSILKVTSDSVDHPNVLRLVKVILRLS